MLGISKGHFPDNFSTLTELLSYRARRQVERAAFIFLEDGETESARLTYSVLEKRAKAIAARLQALDAEGERALLLYPACLEYIAAFFGCLYAGVTAVPTYTPQHNRQDLRLRAILKDSGATIALSTTDALSRKEEWLKLNPELTNLRFLATDEIGEEVSATWREHPVSGDSLAFIQYTSGSTSTPKGVMVSHSSLILTIEDLARGFKFGPDGVMVSWLPMFHDMGLIMGTLGPVYSNFLCYIMPPVSFLKRPIRWLQAISRYGGTHCGAPNFAFELCVRNATPEQISSLDLSCWKAAITGAEPVREDTLRRFSATFKPCGFQPHAFCPGFGLAEATLKVTSTRIRDEEEPLFCRLDGDALAQDRIVEAEEGCANEWVLAGCGWSEIGTRIAIVDPETLAECPPDRVGEVWVSGPVVAQGYWNKPEETEETFNARLADTDEGPFMRTGDLGFVKHGHLFITGRLKDLIIIRGLNHYPQDIELTVERSSPAFRPGCCAAFSVEADGEERLAIVQEVKKNHIESLNIDDAVRTIRQAVAERHEIQVHAILLLKPGGVRKTTSGKIQRRACRAGFLDGSLDVIGRWTQKTEGGEQKTRPTKSLTKTSPGAVAIQAWLVEKLALRIKISPREIDIREPFSRYGLDSAGAVGLAGELEDWLGCNLPNTIAYDYPTIEALSGFLSGEAVEKKADSRAPSTGRTSDDPVAIIGLSCRFPGAEDPEAFWRLLNEGIDAITEVPPARWDADAFYAPDPATPGKTYTRWGGFIENVDRFDPEFFGISPVEAKSMDPQQRLLLEVAWEALERALIAPARLAGTSTGVFVGISGNDYARMQFRNVSGANAYAGTGNALCVAANRLSYLLDLRGPSWAVDTACSSSLVAVHQACRSLKDGECNLALAAGVNLMLTPHMHVTFSQARMMSPDGRCKTFDAGADGYVRGEGCGVVVLKRLLDAQRDGDVILAVIRGSAVNQDGLSNGLTAPNGRAQQAVVRRALADAGVTPDRISYVEAHGTGTRLGDPIELNSLREVLMQDRSPQQPCWIGSVKTNVGHLESAAGIAGLIKTVLSLRHKEIPANLHFRELNPQIHIEGTPLSIPARGTEWPAGEGPRLAGVSSFGFGGTNAHVILEEAPAEARAPLQETDRPLHVLTVSARSEEALRELCGRYADFIETHDEAPLADVCFSANTGRSHFDERVACVSESAGQLCEQLRVFAAGKDAQGLVFGTTSERKRPEIAFLFTGQGSQYEGMGKELYDTSQLFRDILHQCDEILRPYLEHSLLEVMYPSDEGLSLIDQTAYTQPALFSLEYALAMLWKSWGIEPTVVTGHSLGEYAAACVAGVMSLEEGLKLVSCRGRLMQDLPPVGQMAAVLAEEERVAAAIRPYSRQVSISAINGPRSVVISGESGAMREICSKLEADGVKVKKLTVSHAFHSPLMEPMLREFEKVASRFEYCAPRIPLISNLTGRPLPDGVAPGAAHWRRHTREPVRFMAGMNVLFEKKCDLFVEIGPKPVLSAMAQQFAPENGSLWRSLWLASLRKGTGDWSQMLSCVSELYTSGYEIDWAGLDTPYGRNKVQLPTYAFQRSRYWLDEDGQGENEADVIEIPKKKEVAGKKVENTVSESDLEAPAADRAVSKEQIISGLREMTRSISGIDVSGPRLDTNLFKLGFDSLMIVRLKKKIKEKYGVQIEAEQFYKETDTVNKIAACVERLLPARSPEPARVAERDAPPVPDDTVQEPISEPATAIERIMSQQIQAMQQLMSKQLDLLRERSAGSVSSRPSQADYSAGAAAPGSGDAAGKPREERPAPGRVNFRSMKFEEDELSPEQKEFLLKLIARYNERTKKSKEFSQGARPVLADSLNSLCYRTTLKEMQYPIVASRSEGSKIWDADGNEYVDIAMGYGVSFLGNRFPGIVKAVEEQLARGFELTPRNDLSLDVANLIRELTGVERVVFCNTGSEAVMVAVRIARGVTKRDKIVIFAGSYHGIADSVLATPGEDGPLPTSPGVTQGMIEDVVILDYGTPESLDFIREHGRELAAVLVEPVQSRRPGFQPREFLQRVREATAETGTALIFDEMITGFRIHPGGAQAWFGVEADLVTYGKIAGGGMPVGIVAGKAGYMDAIDGGAWNFGDRSCPDRETVFFAGTFCKHPLAMAASKAALEHLKERGPELQQRLNERTSLFARRLNDFFEKENIAIRVEHFGSLFRFESFGKYHLSLMPVEMDILFYLLLEKGVYTWERRLCFFSAAHTDEDIDFVARAVMESIKEMRRGGFPLEEVSESDRSPEIRTHPVSSAQKRLYILSQIEGGESTYNMAGAFYVDGDLDVDRFERALKRIVERHESLRTSFQMEGQPVQKVHDSASFSVDYRRIKDEDADEFIDEMNRRFDLSEAPMFRVGLGRLSLGRHLLVIASHHIVFDGPSADILIQELNRLYDGGVLPPVIKQYKDYALWHREFVETDPVKKQKDFWLEKFSGEIPVLDLPTDYRRPAFQSFEGDILKFRWKRDETEALKTLAKKTNTTLNMLMLAAYYVLLHRLTGQEDIVVGLPVAGRQHGDFDGTIGMFANTVVTRGRPAGTMSFSAFLDEVKRDSLKAYDNFDYPFENFVEMLGIKRDMSRNPLFDATFVYEKGDSRTFKIENLSFKTRDVRKKTAMFDLTLEVIDEEEGLNMSFEYCTKLFEGRTIQRWTEYYCNILREILKNPEVLLSDVELLSEDEKRRLLVSFNDTRSDYDCGRTIVDLFEGQAMKEPDREAVFFRDVRLTYRELNESANRIAHFLRDNHGIRPDDMVGLLLDRSEWLVAGILGILKAGGAYVPVDPAYPRERIDYILKDSRCKAILTESEYLNDLGGSLPAAACDIRSIDTGKTTDPERAAKAENLAYVTYTSGSTGRPKGVMVTHGNVVSFNLNMTEVFGFEPSDRIYAMTTVSFDISVLELLNSLMTGMSVVVSPEAEAQEPEEILKTVREGKV
ncbi:MAG: aminotransferase class III-fold pyridoxal phosphate-dependent enzyme, partial [bacterium]